VCFPPFLSHPLYYNQIFPVHGLRSIFAWQGKAPRFTPTLIKPKRIIFSYILTFGFLDRTNSDRNAKKLRGVIFVNLYASPFRFVIIPKYAYPTLATYSNVVRTEFV